MTADVLEKPATKRGRKPICKEDLGNDQYCELNKGHAGKHDPLDLVEDDFSIEFVPAEKVQKIRKSTAPVDPMMTFARQRIEEVYAEWVKNGADNENLTFAQITVRPELKTKMVNKLRRAADTRQVGGKPKPVGIHWGESSFVKGGKVTIPFAVTNRRDYNKEEKK